MSAPAREAMAIAPVAPAIVAGCGAIELLKHTFSAGGKPAPSFCCKWYALFARSRRVLRDLLFLSCGCCVAVLGGCTGLVTGGCWRPNCDIEYQVADVCCAVATNVEPLKDAFAELWHEYFPLRCGACFFYEVAELIAWGADTALGGVVTIWVGWLTALLPFAAFVLTYHGGCANGYTHAVRDGNLPFLVAECHSLPV